ncbi:lactate utilization protein C [Siminovitchia acidinfaciens]|uniref:Lactate utilization protein C n=1 Tax=Siminovitchia acidinfaciens TaxID=2321395 RepID=A0A429XUR1_9BACI|nr:lactate utilization protein C [Siminovitchia acidinfaciens]RST71865.1 lactate utilization protein C [Siminovitchia acidinfaciens]
MSLQGKSVDGASRGESVETAGYSDSLRAVGQGGISADAPSVGEHSSKLRGQVANRDQFLDRLAKNFDRERVTEKPVRPDWGLKPQWEVFSELSSDELVEVLKSQCLLVHTEVMETKRAELGETLKKALERGECQSVITWKDPRFVEFGLDKVLGEYEVSEWNSEDRSGSIAAAERADVGITFSDITLAESATVVLFSGEGKGRSVSLLPRDYIAVIPKSTIVPRITQAAAEIDRRIAAGERVASCVNFISGPSNSADIEMSLVVGVHGPVHATYIIVDDA